MTDIGDLLFQFQPEYFDLDVIWLEGYYKQRFDSEWYYLKIQ